MKSYTDLEQSKKLAEILPLESADMYWKNGISDKYIQCFTPFVSDDDRSNVDFEYDVPCWSLAALLNYLREIDFFPSIEADEHKVTMNVCYYDEDEGELLNPVHDITTEAETFIDACYEMIIKLHEQKIL